MAVQFWTALNSWRLPYLLSATPGIFCPKVQKSRAPCRSAPFSRFPAPVPKPTGHPSLAGCSITEKLAFIHPLVYPRFSVLDPETTFSLPQKQIANGVADAFTHVMEQYLTYPVDAAIQDRLAESVLKVLIEQGPKSVANPTDYDSRANVVWAATWALNGAIGVGVPQDWASHMIGHELTALHGIDHARTLAVVMPSLIDVQRDGKKDKILQYGSRVWGITEGSEKERVDQAIAKTRGFYESLGLKTRLSDYGVAVDTAGVVARRLEARGMLTLGERGDISPAVVERILRQAA